MIPEYKTLFFTFSIIRYNSDRDLPNVSLNNSESLLNILISDSFVIVIDSNISYKNYILVFLVVIITLKFLSYLILYNRYYFTFYS